MKVLAVVVLAVAAWETAARGLQKVVDTDRAHIHDIPNIARDLYRGPKPRVLFLGNSLTGHGIDVEVVRAELEKEGLASPGVARVWPVSTGVVDWLYLLERYFQDTGQVPDVVVMGFVAHHVPDNDPEMPIKVRRMARHFCGTGHLLELCRNDLHSYGQRVEALISAFSAAFAEQDLFKERAMDAIVPDFRYGERKINALRMAGAARAAAGGEAKPIVRTYGRLDRLTELLRRNKIKGVFVAMPTPNVWTLDPAVPKYVRQGGMTFLDCRKVPGLEGGHFPDGYHLGDDGMAIFSRHIARELMPVLAEPPAR